MKFGFEQVFVSDFKNSLAFCTDCLGLKVARIYGDYWAQFDYGVDVSLATEACEPVDEEPAG